MLRFQQVIEYLEEYGIVSSLRRIIYLRVCLLVLGSFLFAFPLQSGPFQTEGATSSVKPDKKTEAKDIYSDLFPEVVATVNGESIYGRELERAIRNDLIQIGSDTAWSHSLFRLTRETGLSSSTSNPESR